MRHGWQRLVAEDMQINVSLCSMNVKPDKPASREAGRLIGNITENSGGFLGVPEDSRLFARSRPRAHKKRRPLCNALT
jgi:hypothetical protein